ncbi:hypothetical protein NLI96_g1084 [Meripilus lineatus]|uniref:Uncharacterized protein n=1 Tax=Meripilus lineatus TaxID=2056292 RepID=A0AAD5YN95_9APHY|nr:hypothetical protein NLI96_g1084 [Physisporinus lineatus]
MLSPLDFLQSSRIHQLLGSLTSPSVRFEEPLDDELGTQPLPRRLPREVLYRIFECFGSTTYFGSVGYVFNKHYRDRRLIVEAVKKMRSNLCNAILVCKTWCIVGTQTLYRNPILLSLDEYKFFKNTLNNASDLSPLVRDISLFGFAWLKTAPASDPFGIRGRQARACCSTVLSILDSCQSLDTMTINIPMTCLAPTLLSQSVGAIFASDTGISHRLRKLTLDGGASNSIFPTFTLPNLEVLCLRFSLFMNEFEFPPLPKVHTLILIEPFSWMNNKPLISKLVLPSLRTLEAYDWKYCGATLDHYIISTIPLRTIHVLGRAGDPAFFESLLESGALSKVRELAVGVMEGPGHPFYGWIFPPSLKFLTVFLSLKPFTRLGMYIPATSDTFEQLHRHLLLNAESFALQTLDIYIPDASTFEIHPLGMEDVASKIDEIRDLCHTRGVKVRIELIDIDTWIIERLTSPLNSSVQIGS